MTLILVYPYGGLILKTLSLSEAKISLSKLIEQVAGTDDEIVITKNGRPAAVLVSPDEYESWKETLAVRSDTALTEEIRKGLAALRKKRAKLYTLDELLPR